MGTQEKPKVVGIAIRVALPTDLVKAHGLSEVVVIHTGYPAGAADNDEMEPYFITFKLRGEGFLFRSDDVVEEAGATISAEALQEVADMVSWLVGRHVSNPDRELQAFDPDR